VNRSLPRYAFDILILAVLLLTALLPATLLYQMPRAATFTIDAPPALLPRDGLYRSERFADGSGFYSWTDGSSLLKLPNPGGVARLRIALLGGSPEPMPVRMRAGGASFAFVVRPELRTYTMLLPAADGERIALTIDSPQIQVHKRKIGIGVSDIQLSGGGAVPGRVLLALAIATVGGYTLLRQAGRRLWLAAGIVLAAQALVLLWQGATGWRYGLLGSALPLIGGASLAAVALERWRPPVRLGAVPTQVLSRLDIRVIAVLLVTALCVRLPFLVAHDPVGDLELSARRMGFLYTDGLAGAYTGDGDYMPFRLYILLGLSKLVPLLGGNFGAPLSAVTMVLIKLPALLADLATTALIYCWSRRWRPIRGAAAIAALYTFAPPIWINVAWWGQVDALLMLPLLGIVMLLDRDEGGWSWLCWAIALLIKTQAILLAPLLFLSTLRQYGSRGLVRGAGRAGALLLLAWTPLALAGQGPGLAQSYAGSVERFPRTTVAAYNLWYLALLGKSDRDTEHVIGSISYRSAGLFLLGIAVLLVCIALLRRSDGPARAESAAVLALAFFCFPTQIHERYLFLALAFLVLRIASAQRLALPYLLLALTATLNILGTLKGFIPAVYTYMDSSQLPLLFAAINLLVFGFLIGHLLLVTSAPTRGERRGDLVRSTARPAIERREPVS
jgi:Gpi18-like mannosyltransferase